MATEIELDLKWAASSNFVREIIEALGQPQPEPEAVIDLPALVLQVVGQLEELKLERDTFHANYLVEHQLRQSAEATLNVIERKTDALAALVRSFTQPADPGEGRPIPGEQKP